MAQQGSAVKCLVWDLDDTLWNGTLLEGDRVFIDDEVRRTVEVLDSRGILQSIASKNDHDLAWSRLSELGVAEYFILPQISWNPKSAAISYIAAQLNFSEDRIAFVDDQPAERAEVAFHLPEVRCYSKNQISALHELREFNPKIVTIDASRRRHMYQAAVRRGEYRDEFQGPDDAFLRSLDLRLRIERAAVEDLPRAEELTLRTSQMNATGIHYSEAMLRDLCVDPDHEVMLASLDDRFGSHGVVGLVLVEKHGAYWHLKLLATSCRVVSFGVGTNILNWLISHAADAGVHLVADFRATERNRIMEITYRFLGFNESDCPCHILLPQRDGIERMHLIPDPREAPTTMQLVAPDLKSPSSARE
ncbi:MAG: HAD-IIIC family phosphatase [Mycobacterium sp.]